MAQNPKKKKRKPNKFELFFAMLLDKVNKQLEGKKKKR